MDKAIDASNSGRVCPLDYQYTPQDLANASVTSAETLYIIGGLYGNPFALQEVEQLAKHEHARCVFNGDFNWFNHNDNDFVAINQAVLKHESIRGNVETEISRQPFMGGCGCGYPDNVSDSVVNWSNDIIAKLNHTAAKYSDMQNTLQSLPTTKRINIGDTSVQIIHGDCRSLAGWSLSRQSLSAENLSTKKDIEACNAQIIACTHTCEPIATTVTSTTNKPIAIINNGAAGMPNFDHDLFGVITRIANTPCPTETLYGSRLNNVYIDAIPVRYNQAQFIEWFLTSWPPETAAHQSYFDRLTNGINCSIADTAGVGFR